MPKRGAMADSTLRPSATTSGPMPSPPITAMRCVRVGTAGGMGPSRTEWARRGARGFMVSPMAAVDAGRPLDEPDVVPTIAQVAGGVAHALTSARVLRDGAQAFPAM